MIRLHPIAASAVLSMLLAVGGCAKETPAETQADVATAQAEGAKSVAEAKTDASDTMADVREDVTKTQTEAAHDAAGAALKVTEAQAEAAHKVSIERCESMSGDARALCKKQADTELEAALARARADKALQDPKA